MTMNDLYDFLIEKKLCTIYHDAHGYYKTNEGGRFYHNIKHADRVVETALQLTENPSLELIIAARWHDAVYIPGSSHNERASADALLDSYMIYKAFIPELEDIIRWSCVMIESTRVFNHLIGRREFGGMGILLDADLASLADPYEQFLENQRNILRENHIDPTHLTKSAQFLVKFLSCREKIYHTDKARELFEDKARKNIAMLAEEYL